MADNAKLYDDELYGDLDDLDELDAQVEEELVDPPELETSAPPPASTASTSGVPPAYNAAPSQSTYGQQGQQDYSNGGGQGQYGQEQQQQDGVDRIKPNDMPDEGKMFIGGLNWETTDDGLRAYMAQFGDIDACTIMRDPTGRSRGFAFLTYNSAVSVAKVMARSHHLDGKQIDPKRAIPRAEHERTAKVFVGGLAAGVTSESLKSFLTQFGHVMDATVMFDRETTRSKGFAFATFADEESVTRAMAASGIELEGKQIEIKKAQPRGAGTLPNKFGGGAQQPRFGGGMGNMGNMGNMGGGGGGFGMGGGFDPNSMAMMYQNMMKGSSMGGMGMGGGFDPNAMALMYQNMMKNMGGMSNAPAINPNMAMRNMGNMGNMGNMMGGMGMGNMMGGMGMGNTGMGMGMGMGNMGMGGFVGGQMNQARPVPNAPRGPAAMRTPTAGGAAGDVTGAAGQQSGPGAQRYSTQGSARAKPY